MCGGQWLTLDVVPYVQSSFCFKIGILTSLGSLVKLCWLSSKLLRYLCLHFYSTGITSMHHYAQLLKCDAGDQTQVLMPTWQAIY